MVSSLQRRKRPQKYARQQHLVPVKFFSSYESRRWSLGFLCRLRCRFDMSTRMSAKMGGSRQMRVVLYNLLVRLTHHEADVGFRLLAQQAERAVRRGTNI